jgi:uracil-DNA glycosylase family 4
MFPMSDVYHELLDATIQQLQDLKAQGVRFVPVSQDGLAALNAAPRVAPKSNVVLPPNILRGIESKAVEKSAGTTQLHPLPGGEGRGEGERKQMIVHTEKVHPAAPSHPSSKAAAYAELQKRVLACVKCAHLASSRTNVVFGVGNIDAQIMFVGEAPGADEDLQGEPFVGKAGQLLTKIIQTMGLQRGDVYIANILKCRPDTPGQDSGNRKPTPEEMQTCIPYLHEQIDLIRPKVLVALGGTAVEGLLGPTVGITKLRGTWQTYRGIPLMPTFHPSYLLRNQALGEKRRVWEDMLQVMEKLAMPISDKQRNFFLKG